MSTGAVAALSLVLLLALIFFGVHLSTSLMFTSVLSVFLFTGRFSTAMNVLSQSAWGAVRQYMFGVIPLFVLMGLLANLSGASQELYDSASLLLKKVRGGRWNRDGHRQCDFRSYHGCYGCVGGCIYKDCTSADASFEI